MTLPQINATVTLVTGQATSEDWNTAAGAGSTLWTGEQPGYYRETRERTVGDKSDLVTVRTLIVETGFRDWTEGENVTLTFQGRTITGNVRLIETRDLPGHPLQTTRLTFNP